MQKVSGVTKTSGDISKGHGLPTRYSEFVDRVNAQRFKMMVGRAAQPKLGIPFSIDREEAAAAHRELEHELKPAARQERKRSFQFSPASPSTAIGVRAGQVFVAMAGFVGLMCAYAIQRSLK
jgi:hypothetical protein